MNTPYNNSEVKHEKNIKFTWGLRRNLENNIKFDLETVLCEDVDKIQLVQCSVKWLLLGNYKETLNFVRDICDVVDV